MKYNYFNFKRFQKDFLLTNDTGKYVFLTSGEMESFVGGQITADQECYDRLCDGFFLLEEPLEVFASKASGNIRGNKSYLLSGPTLHIFVLTSECNMNCVYCQARDRKRKDRGSMTRETAKKAVDIALSSPGEYLTFEFQGGEPFLNFDILRYIVLYSQQVKGEHYIRYTVATNLTLLNKDILSFLKQYDISVSVSLDGDKAVHDHNRQNSLKVSAFDLVCKNIAWAREAGIDVSAVQTTTNYSLSHWREIVDTYIELGLNNVFIRPLTPLGTAFSEWEQIGYAPEDFLNFYRCALTYILQKNCEGYRLSEGHATIFLRKILAGYASNYMELRSPCGAALGQIAYYYDGEIYTCDEGRMLSEMGDKAFRLGSVASSTYNEMMDSPICKAVCSASILESAPSCEACVYQPYCGICPVVNYTLYGDVVSKVPGNYRCKIYGGMLDILFSLLKDNENNVKDVFETWL